MNRMRGEFGLTGSIGWRHGRGATGTWSPASGTALSADSGMPLTRPMGRRAVLREDGFTLAELLLAIALLTIGIMGAGAALTLQSGGLAGGSSVGLAAITRANYLSTATMLAQARLEEIKNIALANPTNISAIDSLNGESTSPVPNFMRSVAVVSGADPVRTRQVTVQVTYRPPAESGLGQQGSIRIVTIISQRPN